MTTACPDGAPTARPKRPGISVYNSDDGTSVVQVDPNITADDLSSGLARLVPAGARLTGVDQPEDGGPAILRFRSQR